jgi:hypothetical protein
MDEVKRIISPDGATATRVQTAKPLLDKLKLLYDAVMLPNSAEKFKAGDKIVTPIPARQRFVLQYTKYLLDTERFAELAEFCREALSQRTFQNSPHEKWMHYRLALALKDTDPEAALIECERFIAVEFRSYSLLLKAEILAALNNRNEAQKAVAQSLQIIQAKDLPFIVKNLTLFAELSDDLEVKKAHIQTARAIRVEQGHPPLPALEQTAQQLNLGDPTDAPDAETLRAMWDAVNPNAAPPAQKRSREKQKHVPSAPASSETLSKGVINEYMSNLEHAGEVGLTTIIDQQGTAKRRPAVIVGQKDNCYLVMPIQSTSKHPRAIALHTWQTANLKYESFAIPRFSTITKASIKVFGRLGESDIERLTQRQND